MKYTVSSSSHRKTKGSGSTQRATKQVVKRKFPCPLCDRWCTRPCELDEHLANHQGIKRYTCICPYSTAYRSNLNRHRGSCKVLKARGEFSPLSGPSSTEGPSSALPLDSPEASGMPSSPCTPAASSRAGSHDTASSDEPPVPSFPDVPLSSEYDRFGLQNTLINRTDLEQPITQQMYFGVPDHITYSQFMPRSTSHTSTADGSLDAYLVRLQNNGFDQADATHVGQSQPHSALIPSGSPSIHGHLSAISSSNEMPPQYNQFGWPPLSPYSLFSEDSITRRDAVVDFGPLAPPAGWSTPRSAIDMNVQNVDNHRADASATPFTSPLVGNLSLSDFGTLFG